MGLSGGEPVADQRFIKRLRTLIGRECTHLGKPCRVIEVLPDEGALVLELQEALPPIQTDQYGQAVARGVEIIEVPLFGRTREELSEEILDLLITLQPAPPIRGDR